MNLILTESRAVVTPNQLRAAYPDVSFPPDADMTNDMLADYGAAVLEDDPYPELDALESLEPGQIRDDEGRWYREWVVIPASPEELTSAVMADFERAIQGHMNAAAVAAGYDDISNAVSYAEEPAAPKFQKDGIAFRKWRSLVWAYAYEQLAEVQAGDRAQPTVEQFLEELPALELPT